VNVTLEQSQRYFKIDANKIAEADTKAITKITN
jgi:hypothetical protein